MPEREKMWPDVTVEMLSKGLEKYFKKVDSRDLPGLMKAGREVVQGAVKHMWARAAAGEHMRGENTRTEWEGEVSQRELSWAKGATKTAVITGYCSLAEAFIDAVRAQGGMGSNMFAQRVAVCNIRTCVCEDFVVVIAETAHLGRLQTWS